MSGDVAQRGDVSQDVSACGECAAMRPVTAIHSCHGRTRTVLQVPVSEFDDEEYYRHPDEDYAGKLLSTFT